MSKLRFDEGKFVEDLGVMVNVAKKKTPSLIVVASDREVSTFNRNFGNTEGVYCCSMDEFYSGRWMSLSPRPLYTHAFRMDDIFQVLSATAKFEGGTVKGKKKFTREEVKEEE